MYVLVDSLGPIWPSHHRISARLIDRIIVCSDLVSLLAFLLLSFPCKLVSCRRRYLLTARTAVPEGTEVSGRHLP